MKSMSFPGCCLSGVAEEIAKLSIEYERLPDPSDFCDVIGDDKFGKCQDAMYFSDFVNENGDF